jgi:hypothetical protein
MVQVTTSEEGERTIITIDGQFSGDSTKVIEICVNQALLKGGPVDVFLPDVATVDQSRHALLSRLAAYGIRLVANGIYTSYIVRVLMLVGTEGSVSPSAVASASVEETRPKLERNHG